MESAIHHELARNNIYGSLARALISFRLESPGLLAEKRLQTKLPFQNDALFYRECVLTTFVLSAVHEFCLKRCQGQNYQDAHQELLQKMLLVPPGMPRNEIALPEIEGIDDLSDDFQEKFFRQKILNEFSFTVITMDARLKEQGIPLWGPYIALNHISNAIPLFMQADSNHFSFGKFPVTKEMQFFADCIRWLKDRGKVAQAKSLINVVMDASNLGGIFSRVSGQTAEEKFHFMAYASSCEAVGALLASSLQDGTYLEYFRKEGQKKLQEQDNLPQDHVQVDIPDVLRHILDDLRVDIQESFMENHQMNPVHRDRMMQGVVNVLEDFTTIFCLRAQESPCHSTVAAMAPG